MEVPKKLWGGLKEKQKKERGRVPSWLLKVSSKSWFFFPENINKPLGVMKGLMEKVQNLEAIL